MIKKITSLFDLFKKGKRVANPALWKTGQITATALAAVFTAALEFARANGYDIAMTTEDVLSISGGIITVVNLVCTPITTNKIGIGTAE